MNETQGEKLGAWAIVELFGHTRIAGFVSEFQVGGAAFVRVDVPEVAGDERDAATAPFTKLFGPSAIYSIAFVDEETARRAVGVIRSKPITIYIPTAAALPQRHIGAYEDVYGRPDSDFGDDDDDDDDADGDDERDDDERG